MIDISSETVVSLSEATRHLPQRRAGKRPHAATIFRWCVDGCRGIKLESIMVGATRCTSIESLQRFFDRLTEAADAEHSSMVVPPPVSKSRAKSIEAAERRLARAGT